MSRPLLYLANWGSRTLHGPGRKLSTMRWPRAWEHGDGKVSIAMPPADALRAVKADRDWLAYRLACEHHWGGLDELGRFQPADHPTRGLAAVVAGDDGRRHTVAVETGDTLLCACARPGSPKRTHPCHIELLAFVLVRAGWDVVLHGERITVGEPLFVGEFLRLTGPMAGKSGGDVWTVVRPEHYGWPTPEAV